MSEQKTTIEIVLSESKGPIPPRLEKVVDETGDYSYETSGFSTVCPGCQKTPIAGQDITKIFGGWYHAECGGKALREMHATNAWLALAHQLARSPSKFTNPETKAIVRNLLKIAGVYAVVGEHDDEDEEDFEPDDGERGPFRVIDGGRDREQPDPWASAIIP